MSILIFKPEGVKITFNQLEGDVIQDAPLAMSFAYAKDGQLHRTMRDGYVPLDWQTIESLENYPVVIHINENDAELIKKGHESWSPLVVREDVVLAGAGPVIKVNGDRGKKSSDVKVLSDIAVKNFIKRVPNFLFSTSGFWMLESILTPRAALVALAADGRYTIFNENYGFETGGSWVFDETLAAVKHDKIRYAYTERDWMNFFAD